LHRWIRALQPGERGRNYRVECYELYASAARRWNVNPFVFSNSIEIHDTSLRRDPPFTPAHSPAFRTHSHTHFVSPPPPFPWAIYTFAQVPKAKVFIASMIGFPAKALCADTFNKALPVIVAGYKTAGMDIVYTPMQEWSGVCIGNKTDPLSGLCCSGQVHPTAAGYLRMASAFALSIAESP